MGFPPQQATSFGNVAIVQTETYPFRRDAQQPVADPRFGGGELSCSHGVPPPVPPVTEIILSNEQMEILELVEQGKNIFFTGAAGSIHFLCRRLVVHVFM